MESKRLNKSTIDIDIDIPTIFVVWSAPPQTAGPCDQVTVDLNIWHGGAP